MTMTPKRRIVRRTVMALAGVVLLLSGYIGGYLTLSWMVGRRSVDDRVLAKLEQTVFVPLVWYMQSDLPGGTLLQDFSSWVFLRGDGDTTEWSDYEPIFPLRP